MQKRIHEISGCLVISFLQANEISGYLAEEASSRMELFCCTTMHVRILPGRHKPSCVNNSIGTSSSILRTVRTWHRRTFSCFQNWRNTLLVNTLQTMKTWRMPNGIYTNWCQGTRSALMSKATMWRSIYSIVYHHHQCSVQGQVLYCKLRHQGCKSAQRQVFHCKLRNLGCSFTSDE